MKTSIKYCFLLMICVFSGCKKDIKNPPKVKSIEGKVRFFTFTFNGSGDSQKHEIIYNNDGLPIKLKTDSLLSVEILSISDTLIKANVFMNQGEEEPYAYEPVLYEISISGNKILEVYNTKFPKPFGLSLKANYASDQVVSYMASSNLNLGLATFPASDYYASEIVNSSLLTSLQLEYDELDAFYNVVKKKKNVKVEYDVSINDQNNIIPMQYFIHLGDWFTSATFDECTRLIYLLALNGYQVGPPLEKYISKLYIDDNIYRVYEYEKDASGKVNKMHLKYTPERDPYATFTMEYY